MTIKMKPANPRTENVAMSKLLSLPLEVVTCKDFVEVLFPELPTDKD
jgi:hypothetical protein